MRKLAFFMLSCCLSITMFGQDRNFTQYNNIPLELSPSNVALAPDDVSINALYREQWGSIINPFKTAVFSGSYKVMRGQLRPGNIIGLGFQFANERAGSIGLSKNDVKMNFAYAKSFDAKNRTYLSVGSAFGYVFENFNNDKLVFDNQIVNQTIDQSIDPREQMFVPTVGYFDLNVGFSFSYVGDKFTILTGGSVAHLNQPNISLVEDGFHRLDPLNRMFLSTKYKLARAMDIQIGGVYASQGSFSEKLVSSSLIFEMNNSNKLRIGAGYRFESDAALLFGYEMNNLAINISYDFTTNDLVGVRGNNTFELGASYAFSNPFNPNLRPVYCPKF